MTPEGKTKTTSLLATIIRCIFIAILSILLVLGIAFQAPWKVLTLIAIFLATATIVPKPARKYIWLTFTAVVIAIAIWAFIPETDTGEWKPYTFDKELAALEAKRAIPDSENAATIYIKLLENYDPRTFDPNFLDEEAEDITTAEPWLSKDYPELAQWIKNHDETIAILFQASTLEKCMFALGPYPPRSDSVLGKSRTALKRWRKLLIMSANNDLAQGRTKQAIEKQALSLRMAFHLQQQPTVLDMLVARAIEVSTTRSITQTIMNEHTSGEDLQEIEHLLNKITHNWPDDFLRVLEYDKLYEKNVFGTLYEKNSKGKIRLSKYCIWSTVLTKFLGVPYTRYSRKITRLVHWFYIPARPELMAECVDDLYSELHLMAQPDFDWRTGPDEFSWTSVRPNFRYMLRTFIIYSNTYDNVHRIYVRIASENRAARLMVALKRYKSSTNKWPQNLEAIKSFAAPEVFIDPVNGDCFVYKPNEEGFSLYSKGINGIDEHGKANRKEGTDDLQFWPPKDPRKSSKTATGKTKEQAISTP